MYLPTEFADKMKKLLGEEFEYFRKSYEEPRNFGLRVNTGKISPEEFVRIAPFHLRKIPWVDNGFYYEEQDAPSRHPFYYAGLYYLLLTANDISASRAKALLKNVEVFGIPNSFLVNEVPARISGRFEAFFDKALVDAPCSGEGMFRKDGDVAKAWDMGKPQACAAVQKDIVLQAARMLRPGGMMLYSTCTFSPSRMGGRKY